MYRVLLTGIVDLCTFTLELQVKSMMREFSLNPTLLNCCRTNALFYVSFVLLAYMLQQPRVIPKVKFCSSDVGDAAYLLIKDRVLTRLETADICANEKRIST